MWSAPKEPGSMEWTVLTNSCGPVIALNYLQRGDLFFENFAPIQLPESSYCYEFVHEPFSIQKVPFSAHTVNYSLYGTELVAPNLCDAEKTLFVFVTSFSIKLVHRASVADRSCPHYLGNIVYPLGCLYRLYIKHKNMNDDAKSTLSTFPFLAQICTCLLDPGGAWRTEFWLKSILQPLFTWGIVQRKSSDAHLLQLSSKKGRAPAWCVECHIRQNICRTLYIFVMYLNYW